MTFLVFPSRMIAIFTYLPSTSGLHWRQSAFAEMPSMAHGSRELLVIYNCAVNLGRQIYCITLTELLYHAVTCLWCGVPTIGHRCI